MMHLRGTLEQVLHAMPKLDTDFSPMVSLGNAQAGTPLGAIPDATLRTWMQDATPQDPEGDAKLQAAYLMGDVTFALGEVLAGLALRNTWLVAADPVRVALAARQVTWDEDGETGSTQVFDLAVRPDGLTFSKTATHPDFAMAVEAMFAPLVHALNKASGLSNAALYRLVGDSFGCAFLAHGRLLGCDQAATDHACAVFHASGTKLRNKQLRFDYITLPEAPHVGDWLRVRGGCCRAYTRPGKPNYCTTCVLRDDASRIARYRNYLRRTKPNLEP